MSETGYESDTIEQLKQDLLETSGQINDPNYRSGPHWFQYLHEIRYDLRRELAHRWFGRPR